MATLSTLSACYWRQSKFVESINCMDLELKLASHLNTKMNTNEKLTDANKETYLNNIYRIYGNLASAYQRLDRYQECLQNFENQLEVSLQMKDNSLVINTNNSIGLVYNKLKKYEKSLQYFEKTLQLINAVETEGNKAYTNNLKLNQFNLLGKQQKFHSQIILCCVDK
jgi:tetratricopeptide (TPR) repeat protein